jgi:hypothetical protein
MKMSTAPPRLANPFCYLPKCFLNSFSAIFIACFLTSSSVRGCPQFAHEAPIRSSRFLGSAETRSFMSDPHCEHQKRRLRRRLLDKNNLALDLKHSVSEVWLLGPKLGDLDKNNLASAQVLILQSLSLSTAAVDPS